VKSIAKVKIFLVAAAVFAFVAPVFALAGSANVKVVDDKEKPVQGAIFFLVPANGKTPPVKKGASAIMDQKNMEFVPEVLPVQVGTSVSFPNSDNIHHNVYSFSPAKQFDLPLYKGRPGSAVVFDKPGVVVLGCNIHDWMKGYIVVLDTPYFGKTGVEGAVSIENVLPGEYTAYVWHADAKGTVDDTAKKVTIGDSDAQKMEFEIKLKPKMKMGKAPDPSGVMQY
jgi:plastocyanin